MAAENKHWAKAVSFSSLAHNLVYLSNNSLTPNRYECFQ